MKKVDVVSLAELRLLAEEVLAEGPGRDAAFVILLSGELGAGKTAFVKELASLLRISHEITSPTFVIMKSYDIPVNDTFTALTHIDAYRIEDEDEMRVLGFGELLNDVKRIVCIEWPEKIEGLIPKGAYPMRFEIQKGDTRSITYGN